MTLTVREMTLAETEMIIDYFQGATPEYLEMLGVDPTRLPTPEGWRERFQRHFALPVEKRLALLVIWLSDDRSDRLFNVGQDHLWRAGEHASACHGPGTTK